MAETSEIKKGVVIRHKNDLFIVKDFSFVNPGKGCAFTKTKMKSVTTERALEITYKSGENVDIVQVQRQNMQYLYMNGEFYSFMIKDTYETIDINKDVLAEDGKFLKEGLDVMGLFHENVPVAVDLPKKVQYEVADAPPAVKGDSASGNVTKEIGLENGLKVHAPIFIKDGDQILVNTETGQYDCRVNE
ncbi:MAG: elongation factor P [Candidatus Magasanikbacteria bacterium]|jgi:elongation factor P|nr:elongation factor P [Candidatus Magasanikbacteria bacterium]